MTTNTNADTTELDKILISAILQCTRRVTINGTRYGNDDDLNPTEGFSEAKAALLAWKERQVILGQTEVLRDAYPEMDEVGKSEYFPKRYKELKAKLSEIEGE